MALNPGPVNTIKNKTTQMANGKAKGSKGERELSKWWSQWTGFDFTRVPSSGGLRWKGMVGATTGDIVCAHDIHSRRFQFSVECKTYKDINFEHYILGNKKSKLKGFWEQASDDAIRGNKVPILFMRYNGMAKNTYFVMMPLLVYNLLFPTLIKLDYPRFLVQGVDDGLVIMNSNDLLKFDYMQLHKKLKKARRNA